MTLVIGGDQVTVHNVDPDEEIVFRYRPGSGIVNIASVGASVVVDLDLLVQALQTVKRTEENELLRMKGRAV